MDKIKQSQSAGNDAVMTQMNNCPITMVNCIFGELQTSPDVIAAYGNNITKYLSTISPKNIISPKRSVVGPALEAARWYVDEEYKREIFAKLIAAASNRETSDAIQDSFVEIIKQLSVQDVNILKSIQNIEMYPIVSVRKKANKGMGGYRMILDPCIILEPIEKDEVKIFTDSVALVNLQRLGLVVCTMSEHITRQELYEVLYEQALYIQKQKAELGAFYHKGLVRLTPYGKSFVQLCL